MSLPIPGQTIGSMPLYPSTGFNTQPVIGNQGLTQPRRNVIRVDGLEGAYRCALPEDTESIIVIDQYKPLAYLITMNGINRNVQAFDIQLHAEQTPSPYTSSSQQANDKLATVLTAMNDKLSNLEVTVNELKSINRHTKPGKRPNKSNGTDESGDGANDNSASDSNS